MKRTLTTSLLTVAMMLALAASPLTTAFADDDKPKVKVEKKEKIKKAPKLFGVYKNMDSLTDEQRHQIQALRDETNAKIKEIRKAEQDKIMALLTDEQKAQVEKIQAEREAKMKEKRKAYYEKIKAKKAEKAAKKTTDKKD